MKITFISDTHNLHDKLKIQPCDVLVHCGDVTTHGTRKELFAFLKWFEVQPATRKLFVAGNHDFCLDHNINRVDYVTIDDIYYHAPTVEYLCHTKVEVGNVKFYGHPYTPIYGNFAFMDNEENLKEHDKLIPSDTDILITHGPPFGIMDLTTGKEPAGSFSLLNETLIRVIPDIHAFGHIHEGYGIAHYGEVQQINAANHTWLWKGEPYCPPISVEYEKGGKCIIL